MTAGRSHPPAILSTQRLLLRPCVPEDVQPLHDRVFSNPVVMRFVFSGATFSPEQSAKFIHERFGLDNNGVGFAALVERSSNEVIGFSGLVRTRAIAEDDLELGFVLGQSSWGRGYATEIGRGQIEFGLQQLRRRRLLALVDPDNISSIRVVEKLGMKHDRNVHVDGRGVRCVYRIELGT